ncbi:hypothetical protein [Streptomyces virginiae]|uniref:hypothetical protein n=1 Tax=Streptomyces virginiae TaxID=1961 RepID=UPI000A92F4CE|nr:hypothetical protein [Streptomyces virginiae]
MHASPHPAGQHSAALGLGKFTATELIAECGLRRDVVYEHRDLIDAFKALPEAAQKLADRVAGLEAELNDVKTELGREHETNTYLRRVIAELSIELEQTRHQGTAGAAVTPLTPRQRRFRQRLE